VLCKRGHSDWALAADKRYCRTCQQERKRTAAARGLSTAAARKYLYGITAAEFDALLASQNNACAICGRPPVRPSLDHDHSTGTIRGILCHQCNIAIGLLQDSPRILRAGATYLESH